MVCWTVKLSHSLSYKGHYCITHSFFIFSSSRAQVWKCLASDLYITLLVLQHLTLSEVTFPSPFYNTSFNIFSLTFSPFSTSSKCTLPLSICPMLFRFLLLSMLLCLLFFIPLRFPPFQNATPIAHCLSFSLFLIPRCCSIPLLILLSLFTLITFPFILPYYTTSAAC